MSNATMILIVEDSQTQAVRLRYILEHAGYQVVVANHGMEALAILEQQTPAILISDIMMPEMDGFELCRRIKADARLHAMPIVLLTALCEPEDVFKALQAGADNFITKPYEVQSLLSNLRRILSNIELRRNGVTEQHLDIIFAERTYRLDVSRLQIVDFLLSTYESTLQKNRELDHKNRQLNDALENIAILEANYRHLLETYVDAVLVLDQAGVVHYANPAAHALFAENERPLVGMALPFQAAAGERREIELERPNGATAVAEMCVVETDWNGETMHLVILRDMTDQVRMREELRQLSLHDQLTDLYNRRGFCLIAEQMIRLAVREKRTLFLMYIDLDGMKLINDTLGHQEGDAALCDLAEVLRITFRKSDIIGRLGGDEFAVMGFSDGNSPAGLLENRFNENILAHNASGLRAFTLSASIGADFCCPGEETTLESLLEHADKLMYAQKRTRRVAR